MIVLTFKLGTRWSRSTNQTILLMLIKQEIPRLQSQWSFLWVGSIKLSYRVLDFLNHYSVCVPPHKSRHGTQKMAVFASCKHLAVLHMKKIITWFDIFSNFLYAEALVKHHPERAHRHSNFSIACICALNCLDGHFLMGHQEILKYTLK
jgi:hypothetical protein